MPSTTSWPGSAPAERSAGSGDRDGPGGLAGPAGSGAGDASEANSDEGLATLAANMGHPFREPELLRQAMAHRSWCGEQGGTESNERLEFLGDAVLGLAVAEHAYRSFPELPEGQLAKIRSAVVNAKVLAELAQELDVGPQLLLGRGEEASGGREKGSILADAFEALVGALYLDGGWETARRLVLRLLGPRIEAVAGAPDHYDHKSRLQELTVRQGIGPPRYVLQGFGPDHERRFRAEVLVGGSVLGAGEGTSKKDAEQQAARQAFEELRGD